MASYWLKKSATDAAHGPYTGTQLKSLASSGQLSAAALVSADQSKWIVAAKVKGLFPETAPVAAPQPPAPLPYANVEEREEVASSDLQTAAVEAQPRAFIQPKAPLPYSSASAGSRNVKWYLVCSIVILGLVVLQLMLQFGVLAVVSAMGQSAGRAAHPVVLMLVVAGVGLRLLALAGWLGLWIYFIVWVYQAHQDMQRLTGGAYPISPGQACGFCFIPFFNLYWIVYMPYKLAAAIDWHLGSTREVTNPVSVMVFQIVQQVMVFPCTCFSAPSPLFFALTMRSIQDGLNKMGLQGAPVLQTFTPYRAPSSSPPAAPFEPRTGIAAPVGRKKGAMPTWAWVVIAVVGSLLVLGGTGVVVMTYFGGGAMTAISHAREQANRVKCASDMRQIGLGLNRYANAHGGVYPSRLEDAVLTGYLTPQMLICPSGGDTPSPGSAPQQWAANLSAGGHCSYVYAGRGLTTARVNSRTVILYEPPGAHAKEGMNILYGDGGIEWHPLAEAQQVIAQANNAPPPQLHVTLPPRPIVPQTTMPKLSHKHSVASEASGIFGAPLSEASAGVLARVDPAVHAHSGTWRIENGVLRSGGRGTEIIGIPCQLPDECDITLDFVRLTGDDDVGLAMRVAGSNFMFLMGHTHNSRMGVDMVGSHRLLTVPESIKAQDIVSKMDPHQLIIKVRKTSFEATLDQKYDYKITPDYSTWKLSGSWQATRNDTLGLATLNSSVEFRSLKVDLQPTR